MKTRYLLRTRFREIVAEFLPPALHRAKKRGTAGNVVIFCPGWPSAPSPKSLMEFLSQKGFWCFALRYRGSWESSGMFLRESPEKDVVKIIDQLPRGFTDIYNGTRYKIKPSALYVFGSSFGGPAAILASRDPRVTRAVVVSPVIDWRRLRGNESIDWMAKFIRDAFGEAYRGSDKDWMRLKTGRFYNPATETKTIDGKKILLFQARDDRTVWYRPAVAFARVTGASLILSKRGGHFGSSFITKPAVWKKIKHFLK
jgi:pimeloyl-ACP methyl ester carboxylesterase